MPTLRKLMVAYCGWMQGTAWVVDLRSSGAHTENLPGAGASGFYIESSNLQHRSKFSPGPIMCSQVDELVSVGLFAIRLLPFSCIYPQCTWRPTAKQRGSTAAHGKATRQCNATRCTPSIISVCHSERHKNPKHTLRGSAPLPRHPFSPPPSLLPTSAIHQSISFLQTLH